MRIGFLLPTVYAIDSPGNGVRVQAWRQAEALERAGHEVLRLNPWNTVDAGGLDVVQFYMGGFAMHSIEDLRHRVGPLLAFAPMIDSNQSFFAYRLAAAAGSVIPRLWSVPGELRRQALGSDMVIVRSTHERERVIRGLGIAPSQVEIVLNGTDPVANADPEEARRKFNLPEHFVLHVSAYTQPRKNTIRLLQALGPTGYPLVLTGTAVRGAVLDQLEALANRFASVQMLPFVDQHMLHNLYAACRILCLPSIHEGTGLVALEAAALGAKIVITRNGGPRDYFHNFAEYVDPFDIDDIRAAVDRAWHAPNSDALRDHVVKNLTWDGSARSLIAAYQRHIPSLPG